MDDIADESINNAASAAQFFGLQLQRHQQQRQHSQLGGFSSAAAAAAATVASNFLPQKAVSPAVSSYFSKCLQRKQQFEAVYAAMSAISTANAAAVDVASPPPPLSHFNSCDKPYQQQDESFRMAGSSDTAANPSGCDCFCAQQQHHHLQHRQWPGTINHRPPSTTASRKASTGSSSGVSSSGTPSQQQRHGGDGGGSDGVPQQSGTAMNRFTVGPTSAGNAKIVIDGIADYSGDGEATTCRLLLPQVPLCSICGADSTGIHFGVDACSACSAFFRRTVVLNKKYGCSKDGNCDFHKDAHSGQKCRACRFQKCLRVGMDRTAVQHRRDAIGRYSTMKREASPSLSECHSVPSTSSPVGGGPTAIKSPRMSNQTSPAGNDAARALLNVVDHSGSTTFRTAQGGDDAQQRQQTVLECSELSDFGECMYQLWRVEPRLVVEFIDSNCFLRTLPSKEKAKIFSNFMLTFQAIEEPYVTWKHGGLEKKFWMMPNRIYVDFNNTDHYFDGNKSIMKALNLDKTSAINLFLPSFEHAMTVVGEKMAAMNITKTEMVALVGIVLLDPSDQSLDPSTQEVLSRLRDRMFKDLMRYYEEDRTLSDDPDVRLGNLILLMSGVKIHSQRSRENMHLLKIFDVCPRDELFDEVVGISNKQMERGVCGSEV